MSNLDIAALLTEVQALRTETAAHLSLAASLKVRADAILERLNPLTTPPAGVHFNGATWREIARAVAGLPGLKPSLVRGYLNRGCKPVRQTPRVDFRLEP